jgi:hypothetical protein
MQVSPHSIVIAAAIVFLALATLGVPSHPRFAYGWVGMLCWLLAVTVV